MSTLIELSREIFQGIAYIRVGKHFTPAGSRSKSGARTVHLPVRWRSFTTDYAPGSCSDRKECQARWGKGSLTRSRKSERKEAPSVPCSAR